MNVLDELICQYPALAELVKSSTTNDGWLEESHRCLGVGPAPAELAEMKSFSYYSDGCWAKHWDARSFDAVLPDGTVAKDFVARDETVGAALRRLGIAPVLIVERTYYGGPQGPSPNDGYQDQYHTLVYRLTG
jgi:hypothetical protein